MSLGVTISIDGIEETVDYFEKAGVNIQSHVSAKLAQVCQEIAAFAFMMAPKKSGDYANSIYVRQYGPMRFAIIAGDRKAVWIEFGTAAHWILPKKAMALRFEVGGEIVYARIVHHPGTPPQFILHLSKKANIDRVVTAIQEGVRDALLAAKE